MLLFSLSKEEFEFLKKYIKLSLKWIKNVRERDGRVLFEISEDNKEDFQDDIISAIIHDGMDNQDTVNDLGIEMYRIHDNLMYSEIGSIYRPE